MNSVIKGSAHAILIEGSGDIELTSSTVESEGSAVTIQGSGNVSARDTSFQGKKVVQGTGEYEDRGGNTWKK
jgi:hypothetical protein